MSILQNLDAGIGVWFDDMAFHLTHDTLWWVLVIWSCYIADDTWLSNLLIMVLVGCWIQVVWRHLQMRKDCDGIAAYIYAPIQEIETRHFRFHLLYGLLRYRPYRAWVSGEVDAYGEDGTVFRATTPLRITILIRPSVVRALEEEKMALVNVATLTSGIYISPRGRIVE